MGDILKEAIADAKAVRETALQNAKMALEEAFTPQLKSMLSAKLKEDELEEGEPVEPVVEADEEEDVEYRPCIADLASLVESSLVDNQKTIFSCWAGISKKKMGVKEIANYLGMTPQYVYDNLKAAQRTLKRIARENNECPSSM